MTNPSPAVDGTVKATRRGDVVERDFSGTIHLDDPDPDCGVEKASAQLLPKAVPDYADQTDAADPNFAPAHAISPRRLRHWPFSASKRRIQLAAHKTTTVKLKGGSSTTAIRWQITYRRTD